MKSLETDISFNVMFTSDLCQYFSVLPLQILIYEILSDTFTFKKLAFLID